MIELDTRNLAFLDAAIAGLMGALLGQIWLHDRSRKPYAYWAAGNLACGAGWLLIAWRGTLPDFASIVVANSLVATGFALLLAGVQQFNGMTKALRLSAACVAGVFAGQYFWISTGAPVATRITFVMWLLTPMLARIVWNLLRAKDPVMIESRRTTTTVFGSNALLYFAAAVVIA